MEMLFVSKQLHRSSRRVQPRVNDSEACDESIVIVTARRGGGRG